MDTEIIKKEGTSYYLIDLQGRKLKRLYKKDVEKLNHRKREKNVSSELVGCLIII